MNTPFRRVLLALTAALGLDVGIWAEFLPRSFYTSFPGFGLHWIDIDGAWDEHLITDVGSLYLALTALSLISIAARTALPGRMAGVAWTVFGILHFGYHLTHPEGTAFDIVGTIVSLGISLLLGALLVVPPRRTTDDRTPDTRTKREKQP